jgi:hypothetical protein
MASRARRRRGKQLVGERGNPRVYWQAYKPPGDTARAAGENECIYSRQTPFTINSNGENKPQDIADAAFRARKPELENLETELDKGGSA